MEMNIMHGYGHHDGRGFRWGMGGCKNIWLLFPYKEVECCSHLEARWCGGFGCWMEWGSGVWAVDVGQLCAVCGGSAAYFKINARGGCRGSAAWGKYQGERGENQLWSLKLSKHRNNNSSSSNNTSSKSSSFCASQKGYWYTKQN